MPQLQSRLLVGSFSGDNSAVVANQAGGNALASSGFESRNDHA